MIAIRAPRVALIFALALSLGVDSGGFAEVAAQDAAAPLTGASSDASVATPVGPAECPNRNGTCASFGQDRAVCVDRGGQHSCAVAPGGNLCSDGQVCPAETVCGNLRRCKPEDGRCSFPCYVVGPVTTYDGAEGGPCRSVDSHGVTHVCKTKRCSANSPSVCLAAPRLLPPPSPGG